MEWKSLWLCPPPRDGSWFMAMHDDYSGAVVLAFRNGEWYEADGTNRLYGQPEDIEHDYACWTPLPLWMVPWLDAQGLKEAKARQ